jgi:hypothetical protein
MSLKDANPSSPICSQRSYGLENALDHALDPTVQMGAAKFWSHEYEEAMHGNKAAQKEIRSTLKQWSQVEHNPNATGKQLVDGILQNLETINPKAASAFNKAIFSQDGSIEFLGHKHK